LIRFDKRGTGLSDRFSAIPTLEERMDDVRAVMNAVGLRLLDWQIAHLSPFEDLIYVIR
jgi:hypothetical protein